MRFLLLFAFTLFLAVASEAATFYVKPTGSGTQSGADVDNAIGQSSAMATCSVGDTLRMCGGYGDFPSLNVTKADITLLSCNSLGVTNKWSWRILGSAGTHAIYTSDGVAGMTVWGVRILSAYIDGIKNNGNRATNIDCWIANAGRGNPAWDGSGTYRGQGIAFHGSKDMHFERCLIESCGALATQDHGMYGSGTNILIRGMTIRSNTAWGIQVYEASPSDNHNVVIEDNLVHDNGTAGFSNSGLTLWTYGPNKRNRIVNNTFVCRSGKYGLVITQTDTSSKLGITNNIIQADSGFGIIAVSGGAAGTAAVWSDYNLLSAAVGGEPTGANDVVGSATFDDESKARYWITDGSAGRGIALDTAFPATDFFGRAQDTVVDVGFTQYEVQLASDDSRDLRDGARDHWVREPKPFAVVQGASNMEITFTEINQQHALQYIQRKDSVGNTYGVIGSTARGVTTYNDPLSSLTNGLTYTYTATPETSLGNSGGIHAIPVAMVYAAPVISAVAESLITATTATITWTTDTAASARVTYNGSLSTNDANLATSHLINLTGLTAGTLYTYTVASVNAGGTTVSPSDTFTTLSGEAPAPVISLLASSAVTTTTATITWTTDAAASARVTYNGSLSTNDANLETSHTIYLTSLTPSLLYTYTATSVNAGGTTVSGALTFTTETPSAPPPPVGDLTVAAIPYYPTFPSDRSGKPGSTGKSALKFSEDPSFYDFLSQSN